MLDILLSKWKIIKLKLKLNKLQCTSNFLFYVNELELINEINTNIFKKRNELFLKSMIKELQNITNWYLTISKLNLINW